MKIANKHKYKRNIFKVPQNLARQHVICLCSTLLILMIKMANTMFMIIVEIFPTS